jgi:hypothetical protein
MPPSQFVVSGRAPVGTVMADTCPSGRYTFLEINWHLMPLETETQPVQTEVLASEHVACDQTKRLPAGQQQQTVAGVERSGFWFFGERHENYDTGGGGLSHPIKSQSERSLKPLQ